MDFRSLLAGNAALGIALSVVLLLIARANRSFLRDIARDPDRGWRLIARLAALMTGAFIAWTSLLDNWRQLVALPYRLSRRFPSERVVLDPPSDMVRTVTVALLALSLLLVACLLARHVGGYGLQLALLVGALVLWAPLFVLRHRLDTELALSFTGQRDSLADFPTFAAYLIITWLAGAAMITLMYTLLLAAVALPITLLLDLIRRRQPRMTDEAEPFFTALGHRATAGSER